MSTVASDKHIAAEVPAFFRWQPAAWLRVNGPDAEPFLQGQFTNDLRLSVAAPVYGLWLNQKGRVLADSFILRRGGDFWVGSYFSPARVIRERLEAYIIADDVPVEDQTADWTAVTLFGDAEPASPTNALDDGWRFPGRRGSPPSLEWVFPRAMSGAVDRQLQGWRELGADEMEQRRIAARIPAVPADIGPGELPNEGGLETSAISYTKGCYLGQEVIARLRAMGQVRRKLFLVRGGGSLPATPAPLFQRGRQVGELRTAARAGEIHQGLALLSLLHLQPEAPLQLQPELAADGGWVIVPA